MTVTVDDAVPVGETDALILVESVADADAVIVIVLEAVTAIHGGASCLIKHDLISSGITPVLM